MDHILSNAEWAALCPLLKEPVTSSGARLCAQACLFRLHNRMPGQYRSFGWNSLPSELEVSGKTANRHYTKWTRSGVWFDFWDGLVEHRSGKAEPQKPNLAALNKASPLIAAITELERAYHYFNARFLGGELPSTTKIAIEAAPRKKFKGYLAESLWHGTDRADHHIALLSASLGSSDNALHTLLHEMAHLRNAVCGVEDTDPRTQYHTIDFRDSAWLLGLNCSNFTSNGFSATALGERAREAIKALQPVEKVFSALKDSRLH